VPHPQKEAANKTITLNINISLTLLIFTPSLLYYRASRDKKETLTLLIPPKTPTYEVAKTPTYEVGVFGFRVNF